MRWWPALRQPMQPGRWRGAATHKRRNLRGAALASAWAGSGGTAWVRRWPRPYPVTAIEHADRVRAPVAAGA